MSRHDKSALHQSKLTLVFHCMRKQNLLAREVNGYFIYWHKTWINVDEKANRYNLNYFFRFQCQPSFAKTFGSRGATSSWCSPSRKATRSRRRSWWSWSTSITSSSLNRLKVVSSFLFKLVYLLALFFNFYNLFIYWMQKAF